MFKIKIKYQNTEEDYLNFNLHHIENSNSHRTNYNILRFLMPAIFSLAIYAIGVGFFKQPKLYWTIIALGFLLGWAILFKRTYRRIILKTTRKFLAEGDNSSIFGEKTMTIEQDKIQVVGEDSVETIARDSIKSIKDYSDMILIYLSGVSALIIPKRYLNKEQEEYLLNLI